MRTTTNCTVATTANHRVRRIFSKLLPGVFVFLLMGAQQSWGQAPNINYGVGPQIYPVGVAITPLTPVNSGGAVAPVSLQVTTFAKNLSSPRGIAIDASGNIFFTNDGSHQIKKITPAGVMTIIAGSGAAGTADNANPLLATFDTNYGIVLDASGNIYVTEFSGKLRRIDGTTGAVTTIASSGLGQAWGVTLDATGTIAYVGANAAGAVKQVTLPGGVVTTFVGAPFPSACARDPFGFIYISSNNGIQKVIAGILQPALISGSDFRSYGFDPGGNLYFENITTNIIGKITLPGGVITTYAGISGSAGFVNGPALSAKFNIENGGVAGDPSGNVFVADRNNNAIRKIALSSYSVSPDLPDGLTLNASTGVISGTPATNTPSTVYTITAFNASGSSSTTLTILTTNNPGAALNFDGSGANDYVDCGNGATIINLASAGFTMEAWVNSPNVATINSIIRKTGNYNLFVNGGKLHAEVWPISGNPSSWKQINGTTSLSNNTWTHIAFSWDGFIGKLYVNGILDPSSVTTGSVAGSENLLLGVSSIFAQPYTGSMDEVRIWNRGLCQPEIQNNMNCEIPTTGTGLVANYHFNQGVAGGNNTSPAINTLTDASGNGNNGTLINFALTGAISNWVTPGGVISGTSCAPYLAPEINVQGNAVTIVDGDATPSLADHTDFGSVAVGGSLVRTYTIQNTGSSNLTVSGITVTGGDAALFVVGALTPASPIPATGSATFIVTFSPTSAGLKTTTVHIANNDCDEADYDYAIQGTGTCSAPSAPVITATNSTCQPGCTLGGGSFNIVTPCTTGTLTYYSDNTGSNPTTTPPTYNQTTLMTIYYACEISPTCRSAIQTLPTMPGTCSTPATPGNPTSNSPQCVGTGVTLTANVSAPSGETWYWQGTNSTGTSTANNATSTYNAPSSGTYYIRSQNNTTLCWSAAAGVTVSVNALPTITLGANPSVCIGVTSANLPYSGSTNNSPVQNNKGINSNVFISILQYKIDFDAAAHTAGFADVVYTNLPASPIVIAVPGAAPAATYNGTLKVFYPSSGCESIGYSITVTVNPLPSSSTITITNSTCQPGCTVGGGSFNITPCSGSTMTFYDDNIGSNPTTTPPTYNQNTAMTIYYACVNGTTGCRSAIQTLTTVPGTCPPPGTWLGTASTDWFNPSNWCGGIPTAISDVTIPSGTPNSCVIPTSGSAQVHNLTINVSATLTISLGGTLTIMGGGLVTNSGTFINNGTFNQ